MDSRDELIGRCRGLSKAFDQLHRLQAGADNVQQLYRVEGAARLYQTGYALHQFREHERHDDDLDFTLTWQGPQFEYFRFYAEAFYYFAWRFRNVVRLIEVTYGGQVVRPFSGFECKGINSARNRLIEHGDRKGGMIANHFLTGSSEGFVIQPFATDDKGPLDQGLYPNAREFVTKIADRLSTIGIIIEDGVRK